MAHPDLDKHPDLAKLLADVAAGELVPYLGPGALSDVVDRSTGAPLPADSDSLILAMNGGKPLAPKLMYEFPRAAMHQELKKGRSSVTRFLTELYTKKTWTVGGVHRWLAALAPGYTIDTNRDLILQDLFANRPHTLVQGVARIGGTDYRFKIFAWEGTAYREIQQDDVSPALPVLFKPLGSPLPEANYIASDADFVDYITELMGGFAIPGFIKSMRRGKRYLFLGLRMTRDTERMILSDIIYSAAAPKGYAVIAEPTAKEIAFCSRMDIEILRIPLAEFLAAADRSCTSVQAAGSAA